VTIALYALLAVGVVGGGTVTAAQADEPPNHANRLDATFTETNVSVTNRIADLGVFQLINTGTGTVDGFGSATVMLSATQDRSVHPCGTDSWTNAAVRRIVLDDGVLLARARGNLPQPLGPPRHGQVGGGRCLEHRGIRRCARERRRLDRDSNAHGDVLGQAEPRRLTIRIGASLRAALDSVRGEALSGAGMLLFIAAPRREPAARRAGGRFPSAGRSSQVDSRP
jgi:hypothetical protein